MEQSITNESLVHFGYVFAEVSSYSLVGWLALRLPADPAQAPRWGVVPLPLATLIGVLVILRNGFRLNSLAVTIQYRDVLGAPLEPGWMAVVCLGSFVLMATGFLVALRGLAGTRSDGIAGKALRGAGPLWRVRRVLGATSLLCLVSALLLIYGSQLLR